MIQPKNLRNLQKNSKVSIRSKVRGFYRTSENIIKIFFWFESSVAVQKVLWRHVSCRYDFIYIPRGLPGGGSIRWAKSKLKKKSSHSTQYYIWHHEYGYHSENWSTHDTVSCNIYVWCILETRQRTHGLWIGPLGENCWAGATFL
jgi:hypothetical protein